VQKCICPNHDCCSGIFAFLLTADDIIEYILIYRGDTKMDNDNFEKESFEAFKKSFFYGSRTDMNFKFLANLSDEEAGEFFQDLLWKLGDAADDGNFERITDHVHDWQIRGYADEKEHFAYTEGPFTPLKKPVSESRLALLASSGHFVEGDDPEPFGVKNMTQEEAMKRIFEFLKEKPKLSHIPKNTPENKLRVRHGGYDIRGVQADPNTALPITRLLELEKDGIIGQLTPEAYSFTGACAQTRLLKQTGPEWVTLFKAQEIDAALLVPV